MAAHAASFIGSGIGKSGKPCARFTASCMLAIRVISRITDSVKVDVRLAASISAHLHELWSVRHESAPLLPFLGLHHRARRARRVPRLSSNSPSRPVHE